MPNSMQNCMNNQVCHVEDVDTALVFAQRKGHVDVVSLLESDLK
jgi:hypothetical protein